MTSEVEALREMARQVAEIVNGEQMESKRQLWARHNALQRTERPPVLCRSWLLDELQEYFPRFRSRDPLYQSIAEQLQSCLLHDNLLHDDHVFEPWVDVAAVHQGPGRETMWGVEIGVELPKSRGSFMFKPQIKDEEDIEKLQVPDWRVDEPATQERYQKAAEALDGILQVRLVYGRIAGAEQNYWTPYLRGLEQMMWDCVERPEWLHRFMSRITEAILQHLKGLEADGHLVRNDNGGYYHCADLPQPDFDGVHVRLQDTWQVSDAQEFALISPAMWEEFMLSYQAQVLTLGGLSGYGCCETMDRKLEILKRRLPNLRRIACSPWTDIHYMAEQAGSDYVVQWRPKPTEVIFVQDEAGMRADIRAAMTALQGCLVDLNLQDVETVKGQPEKLTQWTRAAIEVGAERYSA